MRSRRACRAEAEFGDGLPGASSGEGFRLIVDALLRLPAKTAVIADGFRLLPHLVKPLLFETSHAVWLVPTREFRAAPR